MDVHIDSIHVDETIKKVTKQLEDLGVQNIRITKYANNLKIAYYSDADVSIIKDLLSNEHSLDTDYSSANKDNNSSHPKEKSAIAYNLDVYELQKNNLNDWSFEGHILEVKTDSDRFSNPYLFTFTNTVNDENINTFYKVAFKINNTVAHAIDNISYKIPEVRAGPNS